MIYLDHNASTNIHPAVKSKMDEYIMTPLNPSSIHSNGRKAKSLLENARKSIANLLGFKDIVKDYHITFTSGGTEANNIVISGFQAEEIFISAIEHPSIFAYNNLYTNITVINVNNNGILDLEDLEAKLARSGSKKKLVSIMLANNETGIIQPALEISKIVHKYGGLLHSDCVQAIGKIDVNIVDLGLDLVTISGHKFGGPTGAGALISKSSSSLHPLMVGGGQERGMRPGTENVPAIIGLGQAAEIAWKELSERNKHMLELRNKIESGVMKNSGDNLEIVGRKLNRLPNTTLVIHPEKAAEIQLIALDLKGVAVSSGSACSSGKVGKSHVLSAMGYLETQAKSAIRISVGYTSTASEIDKFLVIYNELNK
jgi:cysteine desulfurase